MAGVPNIEAIDVCTKSRLLSVIRLMAEDLLKYRHPENKCPVHSANVLVRDKDGVKYCQAAGCGYEVSPGTEPTVGNIVSKYLEQTNDLETRVHTQ